MLSKNNYDEKLREMESTQNHFSIRKLSIGAASVLIGLSFMGLTDNQKVEAAQPSAETTSSVSAQEKQNQTPTSFIAKNVSATKIGGGIR